MDIFFLNDVAEDFFSKNKFSLNNLRSEVSGARSHLEDFCHLENGRNGHKIQEHN